MKLYYLFSRNEKIGSRLIAWVSGLLIKDLDKVPSHMAMLIDVGLSESFVFESTLESGVRILPYSSWLKINEECYKIQCSQTLNLDEVLSKVGQYWGRDYDWMGIAYFGLCFIKHLVFKAPFPKENKWQSEDKYFCNELGGEIANYPKYSMVTPAKMCSDFLKMVKNG